MRPPSAESGDSGVHDVGGSVEIWLADFEMDDVLALGFQRPRAVQDFECSFRPQPRHALGQPQLELEGPGHKAKRLILLPEKR